MAGLLGLSMDVNVYRKPEFSGDFFQGAFYLQHLGEEYCGFGIIKNGDIQAESHEGLLKPNKAAFSRHQDQISKLEGIACCDICPQPHWIKQSRFGPLAIAFNGRISNQAELTSALLEQGYSFVSPPESQDLEIISFYLTKRDSIIPGIDQGIKGLAKIIKGSYTLLILTVKGIYAFCSPDGHWPLMIGEKEGAAIVSSESAGFKNLGYKLAGNCRPGEIIFLRNGQWKSEADAEDCCRGKICSFLWVYTSSPASVFNDVPVDQVRKKLGAILARRDIRNVFFPDIVMPVPDSGRFHAIGYHQEFVRWANAISGTNAHLRIPLYDELLMRFPYSGRSFLSPPEKRESEAHFKILQSGGSYEGTKVVICDDSIVRGTQLRKNLIPKLKSLGIKEIHLRISNPELFSPCPWGKTTQQGEMIASQLSLEGRCNLLGVDSLEYCDIEDLVRAIGLPPRKLLCLDCGTKSS